MVVSVVVVAAAAAAAVAKNSVWFHDNKHKMTVSVHSKTILYPILQDGHRAIRHSIVTQARLRKCKPNSTLGQEQGVAKIWRPLSECTCNEAPTYREADSMTSFCSALHVLT